MTSISSHGSFCTNPTPFLCPHSSALWQKREHRTYILISGRIPTYSDMENMEETSTFSTFEEGEDKPASPSSYVGFTGGFCLSMKVNTTFPPFSYCMAVLVSSPVLWEIQYNLQDYQCQALPRLLCLYQQYLDSLAWIPFQGNRLTP